MIQSLSASIEFPQTALLSGLGLWYQHSPVSFHKAKGVTSSRSRASCLSLPPESGTMALAVVTRPYFSAPNLRIHVRSLEPEGRLDPKTRLQKQGLRGREALRRWSLLGHVPGLVVLTPLSKRSLAARPMLGSCPSLISSAPSNSPGRKVAVNQEEAAKRGGWLALGPTAGRWLSQDSREVVPSHTAEQSCSCCCFMVDVITRAALGKRFFC